MKHSVTIIMPAYNAEIYIREAIQSVIDQTWVHWKLIIIDDGSTDQTAAICKKIANVDQRIMLICTPNNGVSHARNIGLENTSSEYITFLDADDALPLNSLEIRVKYLQENTDIGLVDGRVSIRNQSLEVENGQYIPYYKGNLLPQLLMLNSCVFFGICYFFRASLIGDIRFNTEITHAEDLLFYLTISSENRVKYGCVKENIYLCRRLDHSAMSNFKGLERGYKELISVTSHFRNVSPAQKLLLRARVAKIMLACWFGERKYITGALSFCCLLIHK